MSANHQLDVAEAAEAAPPCAKEYIDAMPDLVPTRLDELTASDDGHPVHLVEGDFFPEEAPPRTELHDLGDGVTDLLAVPPSPGRRSGSQGGEGKANLLWLAKRSRSAKRVRWVDEGASAEPLVRHATTFLMPCVDNEERWEQEPQQAVFDVDRVPQALTPPPVLREEINGDGTTYMSCKAQRPARRFVLWKRNRALSDTSSKEFPFKLQPPGNIPTTHGVPLLAALHPPYHAKHVEQTVLMRTATIAQSSMKGEALCDGGLQMPMVRVSELRNNPLLIRF